MTSNELLGLPGVRIGILSVVYILVLTLSRWLAYQLRFDFDLSRDLETQMALHWSWVVPLKLFLLFCFGQFAGLLSYFSIPDLRRLLYATGSASALMLVFRYYAPELYPEPRGVLLIDLVLSFLGLAAIRLGFRLIRERYLN